MGYLDLWKHTKKQNQKTSFYTFFYKVKNKIGRELGLAPPPVRENSLLFFFYLNPSLMIYFSSELECL